MVDAINGFIMSMPRKAMQELGFQACCLRCDAPDVSGVARCSPCIQHHRNVREVLASAPPDEPLYQLAKEIMAMAAEPHRYDHDEVHGNALIEQQRLAGGLVGQRTKLDGDDVAAVFQEQREREKPNVLQDIANQNPWKNRPMRASEAQKVANEVLSVEGGYDPHYGARTVPSKPIEKVDRTERPGEDTTLTDRVHAAASTHELDEEVAEIFEDIEFNQRQSKRKSLKAAMDEVKELVDDDLEF
ncbi:MAG: hypothetical protein ACPGKR_02250 [Poseidonia sp.]